MNFIVPLILILSSIGIFFGYINPNYKGSANPNPSDYSTYGTAALQNELAKYQSVAQSSVSIVSEEKTLIDKRNTIATADQDRLQKLLPSNIDNIRLIIEISNIAQGRNLVAKNISVGDVSNTASTIGTTNAPYGTLSLTFTVNSSYANFISFLQDLENNLRLVDVTKVNFTSTTNGFYDFTVTLNTYWLK